MRVVLVPSIIAAAILGSACIVSRGGAAVLPARYDVAPVSSSVGGASSFGMRYAAGFSWASWSADAKTPVDGVLGYSVDHFFRSASPTGTVAKSAESDSDRLVHGPFFELSRRMIGDTRQRTWLGLRTDVSFDNSADRRTNLGVAGRVGWELFRRLKGASRNAGVEGVLAVGLFAELGMRTAWSSSGTETLALAGLTVRVPLAAAR